MGRTKIGGISPLLLILIIALVFLPAKAHAFGAGNIASISSIEGKNFRHGDIEDTLKTLAFLKGHKWTSKMINRVYFGNWLRDYSQAMDVGTLKSVQADTIRILVWILAFMTFGYSTEEYEVTTDRLGVYRPEEHIDNPKDYADNQDARQFDKRLRPPVRQVELEIDPNTGMKNYIANEQGDWATSSAYVRYSMERSIHFGRMYTSGGVLKGKREDLCEALRCLGQGLHTLEDFGAHSNYCELALREMGYNNIFTHTGTSTQINLQGHHVFPLVTGTFGMVDFVHSVLGEASDHFTQSELNEMDTALGGAQASAASSNRLNILGGLLNKVPGTRGLMAEAEELQRRSQVQEERNRVIQSHAPVFDPSRDPMEQPVYGTSDLPISPGPPTSPQPDASRLPSGLPGLPDFDPQKTIQQIYPILQFRDKVVRAISSVIEKIPGLEAIIEKITETVTLFVFSLLAPFIRPIINAATKSMQVGSSGVVIASAKHQYEPWTDPYCTDPTHSLLSKDHFANILNEPAGHVASAILRYVVPRVLYAWQHVDVPVDQVVADCLSVFHHPVLRNMNNEAHREMFEEVQKWANSRPDGGASLNDILSPEGVRAGKHLKHDSQTSHSHGGGGLPAISGLGQNFGMPQFHQPQHHQSQHGSLFGISGDALGQLGKLPIPGASNLSHLSNLSKIANLIPGGRNRDISEDDQGSRRELDEDLHGNHSEPYGEFDMHLPPPSGYEQYHPSHESRAGREWKEYSAPSDGAHTYDYHSRAPGYDWDSSYR